MRNALLVNPFSLNAGPGAHAIQSDRRVTPVCSRCHSDDLTCHATAQWSNRSQQWELANTFDQPVHCNSCDSPCTVAWQPLNY